MWRTLCKKALLFYSHSHCRSRWGESLNAVFLRVTTPRMIFFCLNRIRSKPSVGSTEKVSHTCAPWAQIPPLSTNCTGWQFNPHMARCPWERHWTPGYSPIAGKPDLFQALKNPENDSLCLSFINSVICNCNLSHSCSQKAKSRTSRTPALRHQDVEATNCRNPEYVTMLQTGNRLSHIHRVSGSSFPLLYYLISCCKQVIGHFVQVWSLVCVNEAHHLFENLRLHIVDLHTILTRHKTWRLNEASVTSALTALQQHICVTPEKFKSNLILFIKHFLKTKSYTKCCTKEWKCHRTIKQ